MKNEYKLPKKLWAGFTSGKLDLDYYDCGDEAPYGILYTSKRVAKTRYQDVRRVEIREVKK